MKTLKGVKKMADLARDLETSGMTWRWVLWVSFASHVSGMGTAEACNLEQPTGRDEKISKKGLLFIPKD